MFSKKAIALGSIFTSTACFAQSSTTLYGVIDSGLSFTTNQNGSKNYEVISGGIIPSRWGLRTVEDLGGGNSFTAVLENGFFPTTGGFMQGGREFGRQAFLSMSNASYGSLTVGRQYDEMVEFAGKAAASQVYSGAFAHPGDVDNVADTFRLNNAIKYASPTIGGFSFAGMWSFGNVPGAFSQQGASSAGVRYVTGPFTVAASYMVVHNPAQAVTDGVWTVRSGTNVTNPFLAPYVTGTTANPDKLSTWGIGAIYDKGPFRVSGIWTHTLFSAISANGGALKFDNYEADFGYRVNPAWTVAAIYGFTDGRFDSTDRSPKYHQGGLVTIYSLSKRTSVYALGVYQHAVGGNLLAKDYHASNASSNNSQFMARVGMYHKF
jgi:predicted porin